MNNKLYAMLPDILTIFFPYLVMESRDVILRAKNLSMNLKKVNENFIMPEFTVPGILFL